MWEEMSEAADYDPRLIEGIRYFNDCDFFEAHEIWEDLWADDQSASRRFYQGLIQVAVCLHHFGNGNIHGARKLYHSSRRYLADYLPSHSGIDVEKLFHELHACCFEIVDRDDPNLNTAINPDLIPEIHLDPPPSDESTLSNQ